MEQGNPTMKAVLSCLLVYTLLCIAATQMLTAQISVDPTRVLLTHRDRSAQLTIRNPTGKALEVSAWFSYKLLRNDSTGGIYFDSVTTPQEAMLSCREWLKMYPKKFTIPAGTSRSVRVLITPPDTLSEGEYWARLHLVGLPTERPAPLNSDTIGISSQVSIAVGVSVPVIFRKGTLETGVLFDSIYAASDTVGTKFTIGLRRTGNAAYRGTLFANLYRSDGTEIGTAEQQFAAEFSLHHTLRFPSIADGTYKLTVESRTERKGGIGEIVITAPPLLKTYSVVADHGNLRMTQIQ
jgi:hypothetical protein